MMQEGILAVELQCNLQIAHTPGFIACSLHMRAQA